MEDIEIEYLWIIQEHENKIEDINRDWRVGKIDSNERTQEKRQERKIFILKILDLNKKHYGNREKM